MAAPELIFSTSGERLSAAEGFDRIAVTVHASLPCRTIECRATKAGEEYGVGKGTLLASFLPPRRIPREPLKSMTISSSGVTGSIGFLCLPRERTAAGMTITPTSRWERGLIGQRTRRSICV